MVHVIADFDNKPLSDFREATTSILFLNWDNLIEFLDRSDRNNAYADLKNSGLTILVDQYEDLMEDFLDEHDLWSDLHAKAVEYENDKSDQSFNS